MCKAFVELKQKTKQNKYVLFVSNFVYFVTHIRRVIYDYYGQVREKHCYVV